jgi:hypothetical protein
VREKLGHALAALRAFLAGFTGLPAGPRPPTHVCDESPDAAAARRALEERSSRRGTCC